MSDGVSVLDDVLAFVDVFDEHFVTSGCVFGQDDLLAVYVDDVALLLGCQADDDAVGRVNFQISC